ncbi:D-aminoacyl-tRNA deacylase [Magnetofaba australis]|uniref:D-aminoacyl-tRNA deacylase n=1 Tax=Magnetofaba australis IT-1 TaxID=1434232 RepID=A0A1Y2K625_9PROT|nr:D-aminoacyl-tRNA deacylase [Magnetofaba australis]OSM05134.1 putative D-tyrosyl-tRNA(Tyr) deacylase [Magnetofaba australis IT-1]
MKAVVQRVSRADVRVDDEVVGQIGRGLLVLLAVERGDGDAQRHLMARKVARLRIFPDENGKMNLSVKEIGGEILVISQFTLAADMKKGYRPSFGGAEEPQRANEQYEIFCQELIDIEGVPVARGRFAADMQVSLINDGPVTIPLSFPPNNAA